ncbi:unnamed protein product [Schistocephalus solidus]|uniref:Uncharacterized protein n=1 Tax=Schistocephalus solidus TaxID=70667 RepID=A0A183TBH3_SCHSO|nr:unnamed protein product [Schistocephalus solidus]
MKRLPNRTLKPVKPFRLQASMWNRHGIHLKTKLKMHKALVFTTILYGVETLTVNSNQARKLRWQDRMPDTEVQEWTGILSIHAMLRQVQLRWSGHLVRMDDERLSKRLFYGDVATGARRQGGQMTLQGHFEEIAEATANQLGDIDATRTL